MELHELKSIWQAYDNKLEKSLKLNLHCLQTIQAQKVKSKLTPLLWLRIFEVLLHVGTIYWLTGFLYRHFFQIQYAVSAMVVILFFTMAFINCIRQVIIIKQMDYSNDIVSIQSSLIVLRTHLINYVKLSFLCLPTFLAYPIIGFKAGWDLDIVAHFHHNWWTAQIVFSVLMIPVCIWLYKQVSYKNMHKKWVRNLIVQSLGSGSVGKAIEVVNEIEDLKREYV